MEVSGLKTDNFQHSLAPCSNLQSSTNAKIHCKSNFLSKPKPNMLTLLALQSVVGERPQSNKHKLSLPAKFNNGEKICQSTPAVRCPVGFLLLLPTVALVVPALHSLKDLNFVTPGEGDVKCAVLDYIVVTLQFPTISCMVFIW